MQKKIDFGKPSKAEIELIKFLHELRIAIRKFVTPPKYKKQLWPWVINNLITASIVSPLLFTIAMVTYKGLGF